MQTNGRVCWCLNDVSAWLKEKSPEEQDRLVRLVSSVKFIAIIMEGEKERKKAEKEARDA